MLNKPFIPMNKHATFLFFVLSIGLTGFGARYAVPFVLNPEIYPHRVKVINPNFYRVYFDIVGFKEDGSSIFPQPARIELNSHGSFEFNIAEVFDQQAHEIDWLRVESIYELNVIYEREEPGSISAVVAQGDFESSLILPHVAKDTVQFNTQVFTNNNSAVGVEASLRSYPGGLSRSLNSMSTGYGTSHVDISEDWVDLTNFNWGKITSSLKSATAMEVFSYHTKSAKAAIELNNESSTTLRFLHIATDTSNFWTGISYINIGTEPAIITETYYGIDGSTLKSYSPEPLLSNDKCVLLFDQTHMARIPEGTSWLEVRSSQPLVGYELFGSSSTSDDATFAGIQSASNSGNVIDFPFAHDTDTSWTGVALVNLGEEEANLVFTLYSHAGTVLEETNPKVIMAKAKFITTTGTLFANVENGSWIRATASKPTFAGLTLWGDRGSNQRQLLAGTQAFVQTRPVLSPSRVFMDMETDNNSYESAMEIQRGERGFNINLIGTIEKLNSGEIIDSSFGAEDDIERVFKFVLNQPTPLLIAIQAVVPETKLNLMVTREQLGTENFSRRESYFDPIIDYSKGPESYESIARTFTPGTYYILVTHLETDSLEGSSFGLLITEYPIYLNCFDKPEDVERFNSINIVYEGDHNQLVDWEPFHWEGSKQGHSLSQVPSMDGWEYSGLGTSLLPLTKGIDTVFDFDFSLIDNNSQNVCSVYGWGAHEYGAIPICFNGFGIFPSNETNSRMINGKEVDFMMWNSWVYRNLVTFERPCFIDNSEGPAGYLISLENKGARWLIDNVRIYEVKME